jgi:two-component system, cell cycle sensor histidine kinase and response regulator CckA
MNVVTQFQGACDYEPDLRFQAMFEGAAIGIGICRLDGWILEANPALARMLGYSLQELTGAHAGELYPEIWHGPDSELRGKVEVCPEPHRETGGEIYPETFSPDGRLLGELMRDERSSFDIEKRYQRKDGSELWGHLTVSLGRDARRQPAYLIAMLADATERKRVDEHIREAEKMEVIGRLAGGIAHDFNNLLTGILRYCDLLTAGLENGELESSQLDGGGFEKNLELQSGELQSGELQSGELQSGGLKASVPRVENREARGMSRELSQHVDEVRMAGEQGAALTHQLLAIARKQAAEPRPTLINEIVASTKNLLQRLTGEQIELETMLDAGVGRVLADPAQLRQILLNLVLNARDAMPQGGKIRVSTRAAEFPGEPPDGCAAGSAQCAVSLAVQDNGCGMDAETRARLFEPFFTTKKPGTGTGLGLATVQRIVSESGGRIEVESGPGRGTCIEVFFPAIEGSSGEAASGEALSSEGSSTISSNQLFSKQPSAAGEVALDAGGKTILLVDDHPTARKSIHRFLLDAGYRILSASTGTQAQKVFAEHSGAVDLLIADVLMPGMNGQELAEALLRQNPDMKVLLISGYEHAGVRAEAGAVELVRKPFSGKALIERVAEVLRSP